MLRIEVKSEQVTERTGTSKGRDWRIYEQEAWVDLGKAYPTGIRIGHRDRSDIMKPGVYVLSPQCFWVDRYGSLQVDPRQAKPAAAAARAIP